MLFEPSGILRSDYGAYCHALNATEREELFHSIYTNDELRQTQEIQYIEAHPSAVNLLAAAAVTNSTEAPSTQASPETPNNKNNNNNIGSSSSNTAGSSKRVGNNSASGKGKKKSMSAEEFAKAAAAAAIPPSITFIIMRHIKFCLNERDMKPLALAIPHCHSLVSVEFVGCGLSRESYFLLVEALYKSRRIASVTIDFNSVPNPGFYEDPTLTSLARPSITTIKTTNTNTTTTTTTTTTTMGISETKPSLKLSLDQVLEESTPLGVQSNSMFHSENLTRSVNDLPFLAKSFTGGEERTFAPSAYRGLNNVPTQLEIQFREEKERKGKIDSKKLAQLQQQQDQISQIDKNYPIIVPRGWPSIFLTGVKHLSLRGNGINDDDLTIMANILSRHPRSELISLNLWGNNITDNGVLELARVLKHNRTLQVIDLGKNDIGDIGLLQLVDCFRMQEIPIEKLQSYRKKYLTRRDATAREQQLASSTPPTYPSYQELYNAWYQNKFPAVAEEKRESKKASQAKSKKVEPVLIRPTTPFDRDCFRMENSVRVPGNTVLRCINLGNNKRITLTGARESLRILSLREPTSDEEMSTLQNSATQPPELYCPSITLRSFVLLHEDNYEELQEIQTKLSDMLYERQKQLPQPQVESEIPVEDAKKKSMRNKK